MLPDVVVDALVPSPRVVEIGVGGRFEALVDLRERRPDAWLMAVDIDPEALEQAPEGVHVRVDDVHEPSPSVYRGVDLVFARRAPVELQKAIAEIAGAHGAGLALRPLKDEWADVSGVLGPPRVLTEAAPWRWWPAPGPKR